MSRNALIDDIINWSSKADPKDVGEWLNFLASYLKSWGWNDTAIEYFLDWGEFGFNNTALHGESTPETFYGEVHYCSDRMSMDRLFRCHVLYRNLKKEIDK